MVKAVMPLENKCPRAVTEKSSQLFFDIPELSGIVRRPGRPVILVFRVGMV